MMARYIKRRATDQVLQALQQWPAVAIAGARKIGKTTLANEIANTLNGVKFDLSRTSDRNLIRNPANSFRKFKDKLIVLDEVQHVPGLFREMRSEIDRRMAQGQEVGQFLFLGSAAGEHLGQLHETLTGRLMCRQMHGLDLLEIDEGKMRLLWERGSLPDCFLARDHDTSFDKRQDYLSSIFPTETPDTQDKLYMLLASIATSQGSAATMHKWGNNIEVDSRTLKSYLSKLEDAFLIRRLLSYSGKLIKELIKKPKFYIRDSGLAHTLLDISIDEQIQMYSELRMSETSNAVKLVSSSWEGFVIENLLGMLPPHWHPYFYRSYTNHEINLVIDFFDGDLWAIEIRYSSNSRLTKGNYKALEDLNPKEAYVVHSDNDEILLPEGVWSIPLKHMMQKLQERAKKKF